VEKSSLTALAREQLKLARRASSGRSADTVSGEATVHVLHGRVRLNGDGHSWDGTPGDLLTVPSARHSLSALEDSVVLLTVVKTLS